MSNIKEKGIILKEYNKGESDKTLVILLKNKGKINVTVRGARKPNSKYFAGAQLFNYCEFVLFDRGKFLVVSEINIITSFYKLSSDYDKFLVGNYIADLCLKTIMPDVNIDQPLFLLLKSFQSLIKTQTNASLIKATFQLKFLQLEGYLPTLEYCNVCGEPITLPFSIYSNSKGAVCKKCLGEINYNVSIKNIVTIDERILFVINYILESEISKAFNFQLSEDILESVVKLSSVLIKEIRE